MATAITRAQALRDDPLGAQRACVLEHDEAFGMLQVLVEAETGRSGLVAYWSILNSFARPSVRLWTSVGLSGGEMADYATPKDIEENVRQITDSNWKSALRGDCPGRC